MTRPATGAPIPVPLPRRLLDLRRRYLPAVVWTVAAAACAWMLAGRAQRFEHIGLARALQYEVSAGISGRVEAVVFDQYDQVREGDILAKLDDAEVSAEIDAAQATVRRLAAELEAARVARRENRTGWVADLRRFQTDEERLRLEGLNLRVALQGDEIERERLSLQLQRAEPLRQQGVLGQMEYDEIRLAHERMVQRAADGRQLIEQTEREYRAAQERRRDFERQSPLGAGEAAALQPLREAIDAEQARLRGIEARREALVLRSPVAGQVHSVACSRDQSVVPGEPLFTVTERTVTDVVAWIDQRDPTRVQPNTPVILASQRHPRREAESVVLRVGAQVEVLPANLWRQAQVPEYGRAVVIATVPALDLAPGDLLSVHLREP